MIGRLQTAVGYASEDTSPWGTLKLISGSANPELAELISRELGVPLTDPRVRRFPDGEIDVKIQDSMRGHDVFVVQPTCHPINENLMELFIILDALRRASAGRVTAVIPYYGYARKERKSQPREPISAKLIANFVTLAGADRLLLLDLHADAIEGFVDVPTDHLSAHKILADHIPASAAREVAVVAPDAGGAKRAEALATLLVATALLTAPGPAGPRSRLPSRLRQPVIVAAASDFPEPVKPGIVCGSKALRSIGPLGSRNKSLIRGVVLARQDLSTCAVVAFATDEGSQEPPAQDNARQILLPKTGLGVQVAVVELGG